MAITSAAENLLRNKIISKGSSLLQTAFTEANRFKLRHISEKLARIAVEYDIILDNEIKEGLRYY